MKIVKSTDEIWQIFRMVIITFPLKFVTYDTNYNVPYFLRCDISNAYSVSHTILI